MDWTRRQFLLIAGLLPPSTVVMAERASSGTLADQAAASARDLPYDDPAYLIGDPYLAGADEPGLGGRSFGEARERALRFRSSPAERDRYVLGVEIDRA